MRVIFAVLSAAFLSGQALAADGLSRAECKARADARSTAIAASDLNENMKIRLLAAVEQLEKRCKQTGYWPDPVEVSVSAAPAFFYIEDDAEIAYTTVIKNYTLSTIKLQSIKDELPSPFQFSVIDSSGDIVPLPPTNTSGKLTFALAQAREIAVDEPVKFIYKATVSAGAAGVGKYENKTTAVVNGIEIGPQSAVVKAKRKPKPEITTTVAPTFVEVGAGATVKYAIELKNGTPFAVELEKITDNLPAGFSFDAIDASSDIKAVQLDAAQPQQGDTGLLAFNLINKRTMSNGGGAVRLVYTASVPAGQAEGEYDNKALATFTGYDDIAPAKPARVKVGGFPRPALSVSVDKTDIDIADLPETVTYSATITNKSTTTSIELKKITDTLTGEFGFAGFDGASDIQASDLTSPPQPGDPGALTFGLTSPLEIPKGESRSLIYRAEVKAGATVGAKGNTLTAEFVRDFTPPVTATAVVTIKQGGGGEEGEGEQGEGEEGGGSEEGDPPPPPPPPRGYCNADDFDLLIHPDRVVLPQGKQNTVTFIADVTSDCAQEAQILEFRDNLPKDFGYDGVNEAAGDFKDDDFSGKPRRGQRNNLTFTVKPAFGIIKSNGARIFAYDADISERAPVGVYDNDMIVELRVLGSERVLTLEGSTSVTIVPESILQLIIECLRNLFFGGPWALVAFASAGVFGWVVLYRAGISHALQVTVFAVIAYGVVQMAGKIFSGRDGDSLPERAVNVIESTVDNLLAQDLRGAIACFIAFLIMVLLFYLLSSLTRLFTGRYFKDPADEDDE